MTKIENPYSSVLSDPAAVDEVAKACFAQLPANVILEVERVVVTGHIAATLVGHALARQLESRVNIAGVDEGVLYVNPPLTKGDSIIILSDNEPPAADVEVLKIVTQKSANVLATCVIDGDGKVFISESVS